MEGDLSVRKDAVVMAGEGVGAVVGGGRCIWCGEERES